jgi:uncharacterized protein (DUF885 family)
MRRDVVFGGQVRKFVAVLCCMFVGVAMAQQPSSKARERKTAAASGPYPVALTKLADEFMASFFAFQPSAGTRAGLHQYDTQMDNPSAANIAKQVAEYRKFEQRFAALDTKGWTQWASADRDMMLAFARSRILELEQKSSWTTDPDHYSAVASDSAFVLMGRNFAPPEQRLRALIERERKLPGFFALAKQNLKNPPRVFTEVAIEQLPGIIDFFGKDVPAAFADVKDEKLKADFQQSNAATIAAMRDYLNWLQKDLLPHSNGDFRLGAEHYQKKLLYEEMVDVPLDHLLKMGYDDLHRNQREFARTAKLIDPTKTPAEVLAEVEKEHPEANKLLQAFRDKLVGLRDFTDTRKVITTPSRTLPIVQETPAFMRALTFASMDTPGPFETKATEAFFNVTLPEKDWSPKETEEYMQGFNWAVINSTAIHEVFPGHYLQYLWNEHVPSKIRQFLSLDLSNTGSHFSGTNVEGWAHYTEQMMIDEGFGRTAGVAEDKDIPFLKLRLGQIQDALLRNSRYVVAIEMHTGKMTFDQGVEFFQREGYQSKGSAFKETRRGTSDPTYLMYTLGKLQILKLRADLEKREGKNFDLKKFHDEFMRQGVAPLSIIRRQMLGDNSPTL